MCERRRKENRDVCEVVTVSRGRLDKLEREFGGGECPECGADDQGDVTYNILWTEPGENPQEEYCSECGRQTVVVLTWD